jgi:hypothetical protein
MAASMLHFEGYDDFEDYFWARWNCSLSDIIATIPIPLTFAKGQFKSGVAARLLNEFAADPYPYLDVAARKKINMAQSDLLRKFQEIAFDESAQMRWEESQRAETDNREGPPTETDLQDELIEASGNPF